MRINDSAPCGHAEDKHRASWGGDGQAEGGRFTRRRRAVVGGAMWQRLSQRKLGRPARTDQNEPSNSGSPQVCHRERLRLTPPAQGAPGDLTFLHSPESSWSRCCLPVPPGHILRHGAYSRRSCRRVAEAASTLCSSHHPSYPLPLLASAGLGSALHAR